MASKQIEILPNVRNDQSYYSLHNHSKLYIYSLSSLFFLILLCKPIFHTNLNSLLLMFSREGWARMILVILPRRHYEYGPNQFINISQCYSKLHFLLSYKTYICQILLYLASTSVLICSTLITHCTDNRNFLFSKRF